MKKLLRILASGVLGLSMTTGVVMAANEANIEETGPDSHNRVEIHRDRDIDVENDNEVEVENETEQEARSGDAKVFKNTRGGDAETGDAENDNWTAVEVELDNTSAADCLCPRDGGDDHEVNIETTGPKSDNKVKFHDRLDVNVENDNEVQIENETEQEARSGDAKVFFNTRGGDAETGDASNINTSEFVINISN